jgi:hypothetical protein
LRFISAFHYFDPHYLHPLAAGVGATPPQQFREMLFAPEKLKIIM